MKRIKSFLTIFMQWTAVGLVSKVAFLAIYHSLFTDVEWSEQLEVLWYGLEPQKQEQFWLTAQYSKMLEHTIMRSPSYWLWSHRRWKRTREEWIQRTHGGIKPKN